MTDRELMQTALEAMEHLHRTGDTQVFDMYAAPEIITALLARLAHCDRCGKRLGGEGDIHTCTPKPEQEPVAWGVFDGPNLHDIFFAEEDAKDMARLKGDGSVVRPLTTPPAAQRKPLTDAEIYAMCSDFHSWSEWDGGNFQKFWLDLCRAIEAAHGIKEKNT